MRTDLFALAIWTRLIRPYVVSIVEIVRTGFRCYQAKCALVFPGTRKSYILRHRVYKQPRPFCTERIQWRISLLMVVYEEVHIHVLHFNRFPQMALQTAVHVGPTIAPSETLEASDRKCSYGQDRTFDT
jgi:hypothetical protein